MFPNLPKETKIKKVDVFTPSDGSGWSQYVRPPGATWLYIYAIGAGGGGGGGFSGAAGTARGGGGGGSSATAGICLVPFYFLPDVLFVFVPRGAAGGAAGVIGNSGGFSTVSIKSWTSIPSSNVVITSGSVNAPGGNPGTATGGGAATGAPGTAGVAAYPQAGGGISNFLSGNGGVAGGAHTGAVGGQSVYPTTGIQATGGAGGAGTTSADFAGGFVTSSTNTFLVGELDTNPVAGSVDGSSGRCLLGNILKPFFSIGGNGGGSSNTGVGGNGGSGGYGSGGGGGGGGTTGGSGGRGGDGLVIMIAW